MNRQCKNILTRPIRRYALLVFFRPALWRYGVLFSRKRYGVMGALKKALWRYEGPPANPSLGQHASLLFLWR